MARRDTTRRRFLRNSGLAAAGAGALGMSGGAAAPGDGVLRLRHNKDIQVIDPMFTTDAGEFNIRTATLPSLVQFTTQGEWGWELNSAAAIEQVDDTHITFTLKKGLPWTNGFGELTSADVKYSYERVADPANESPFQADWKMLKEVEIKDDHSGVIVLNEPSAPMWKTTLPMTVGYLVCKEAVEQAGGNFTTEPPATCGPYLFGKWTPGEKLVLPRNPDWPGPRPDFERIDIYMIGDDKTAELAFLAGELDMTRLGASSIPEWSGRAEPGVALQVAALPGLEWVGLNTEHEPYGDLRVRQAIRMAIDIDTVLEAAYFGVAGRATGLIPKGFAGYRQASPYPPRDVEGARALLEQAGLGTGFATTITVMNVTETLAMAQVVQANLAEIGIEAEVSPYEPAQFWTLGLESEGEAWKDIEIVIQRWGNGPDQTFTTKWYTCQQVGKWNWERWCNEEYSTLDQQAAVELDEARRGEIYLRMADLIDEGAAYTFLTYGVAAIAYRDHIVPATTPDANRYVLPKFRLA